MLISHPASKDNQRKPLHEHLENVAIGCRIRIQRLSLFTRAIDKDTLSKLAFITGLMHDIGKASKAFQKHVRGGNSSAYTKHSLVSALILYEVLSMDTSLGEYSLLAFKAVQRHHGNLSSYGSENLRDGVLLNTTLAIFHDVQEQIIANEDMQSFLNNHGIVMPNLDKSKIKTLLFRLEDFGPLDDAEDAIERFLIQNLLFSVLIDADKHDAARIEQEIDINLKADISFSPQNYLSSLNPGTGELNSIRSKLLNAAADVMDIETKRFALSAPTGSGKTLACMSFTDALQKASKHRRRVIYCLPYTSIIDQNFDEVENVLSHNGNDAKNPDILLKHHHLVDFSRERKDEDYDLH
ncbi:MAG: CRISPR-associated endonuclease Cas3'', partial [Synergistaceae bacterium]